MRENRTYGSARVCISNGTFYFLVMKCMKVHGAKDRNTVTFLEGKHVENTGGLERHGNKTTRYKNIVKKTS